MSYHASWPQEARHQFELVIKAHGGWGAWEKLHKIHLQLKRFNGFLVFVKGLKRTFHAPNEIIVEPKLRRVEFIYDSHSDIFSNGSLLSSSSSEKISDGQTLFTKTVFEQWTPQHSAYFFGYAWANYLSYPFILPQFELLNYKISSNKSIFEIRFPEDFHTHCEQQKFYFNEQHLLYRHDYRARLAGPFVFGAHYTEGYIQNNGIQIATLRKVRARLGPLVLPVYGIYGEVEPR